MREKCIEGLTLEQTIDTLGKASELINENDNTVRFKKESCRVDGISRLGYTIVKAEDGRYFLLGHYNDKDNRNQNHFLGEGSYSKVRVAYELNQNEHGSYNLGEDYIVKKAKTPERGTRAFNHFNWQKFGETFSKNVSKARKYESKNTTERLIEKEDGSFTALLFTKRVHGNDLENYIINGHFDENIQLDERLKYINSLSEQLDRKFHSKNKAHRDLKPANMMLDPEKQKIKIVDVDSVSGTGRRKRWVTSPTHSAPEFEDVIASSDQEYEVSKKEDIYGLATLFIEILYANGSRFDTKHIYYSQHPAFEEKYKRARQAFKADKNMGKKERISAFIGVTVVPDVNENLNLTEVQVINLIAFLNKMTHLDPEERPDIKEVRMFFMKLPFLNLLASQNQELTTSFEGLLNITIENHCPNLTDPLKDLLNVIIKSQISEGLKLELFQKSYDFVTSAIENNNPEELVEAGQNYQDTINKLLSDTELVSGLGEKIAGSMLVLLGVVSLVFVTAVISSFCLIASPALLAVAPAAIFAVATLIATTGTTLLATEGLFVAGASVGVVGAASIAAGIGFFSKGARKSRDVNEFRENLAEQTENLVNAMTPQLNNE